MNFYKEIFLKLDEAKIRYLIVGGVAVNLYGYSRFTGDIDIVLSLDKKNLEKLSKLMHELGYTERQPSSVKDLGDTKKLEDFVKKKGMKAFTFVSSNKPHLDIDIIVEESLSFEKFYTKKTIIKVWGLLLPVLNIDDLIEMKKGAARDKDKMDIEALLKLKEL
mgnify:CR=1 FL=1